jgi:outer membrane protein, heavy metal efflux system
VRITPRSKHCWMLSVPASNFGPLSLCRVSCGRGLFAAMSLLAAFLLFASAPPALGGEVIEVRSGDSLIKIARERLNAEARWREIAELNAIAAPYHLRVGDTLVLPTAAGESRVMAAPSRRIVGDSKPTDSILEPVSLSDSSRTASDSIAEIESDAISGSAATSPLDPTGTTVSDTARMPDFAPALERRAPVPEVHLDDLLAELDVKNPSIAAARAAARAASFRPSQARSLPDPQLRAQLNSQTDQVGMVDAGGMVSFQNERMYMQMIEASQMIPLGKLEPMGRMEEAMARKMAEESENVRVTFMRSLKTAYAELYLVDATTAVLERTRAILNLLVSSTEAMYRVGEAKQADVLRAQLEVSMIRDRLLMLTGRRRAAVEQINALLVRPAGAPLGRVAHLATYDLAPMSGPDQGPMVRVAQAELAAAEARVDIAQSMFIPDLELMGGIGVESERRPSVSGDPVWQVGVGITVPIWAGTKQEQGLREAKSNLESARHGLEGERAKVRAAWESSLAMGRTARAQVLLYEKTLIPQARLAVDASLSNWRVGSVDFMTVVTNVTTLLGYEIGAIEAIGGFYKSVAMAEEMSGAKLEWRTSAE